ncbi:fatty acid desaturase [Sorangium sp. So ce388]|uniref:fatty acid desaturase n=1 Tax=Sorangium sp. So ce388 TaxID=3133309 RepID=UPI003F5BF2C4
MSATELVASARLTSVARTSDAPVEVQAASVPGAASTASRSYKALIPARLNLLLAAIFGVSQAYFLVLYPLGLIREPSAAIAALVVSVALAYPSWVLIHEGIHNMLYPARDANDRVSRLLSILHGSPFAVLKLVHLLHHKYNRVEDYAEAYDPARTSWSRAAVHHYYTVLAGRYWSEVLACLIVWLPQGRRDRVIKDLIGDGEMGRRIKSTLAKKSTLQEARTDAALCLALLGASFWLYRHDVWVLLAALSGRALLVSFFDDAYHYGTARNLPEAPQPARNHELGPSWIVLHFNHHGLHHRYPSLPWSALPAKAREEGLVYDGGFVASALRQLRGPIPISELPAPAPTAGSRARNGSSSKVLNGSAVTEERT